MLRKRPQRKPARARVTAAAAAGVLLLLLALSGCGDDDDAAQTTAPAVTDAASGSSAQADQASTETSTADEPAGDPATDQAKIKATIEGVLTGSNPAEICDSLVTKRYVKHAYGDSSGCEKAQSKKAAAKKLDIGDISISPEAVAQTSVRAKGGIYGGERLRVVLVLQDGEWRLDSLRSNVPVGP